MRMPIIINEKISFYDIVLKYICRDLILGIAKYVPSALGIPLRMILYKIFLKKCGKGLRIASDVTIKFPENVIVGDNVSFNEYDWIDGNGGIEIGDYVSIGPKVSIISFSHGYEDIHVPIKLQKKKLNKILIENNVWIGANVVITGGVKIGTGSIIGAGSVVLNDVEPYSIVAGVPARLVKKRV
ncbi:DapH/DapD/GlmU-related protein [Clostridium malenominatum]|uniref:DapH/DapD/GlmU-related protein n=1 Tax=Clostridium malenominatum TaxID=1539 RepID=A0ABP3U8Q0_9CLOT